MHTRINVKVKRTMASLIKRRRMVLNHPLDAGSLCRNSFLLGFGCLENFLAPAAKSHEYVGMAYTIRLHVVLGLK